MNRRKLLQFAPAVIGVGWLGETAAQGTPVASPAAWALPQTYSDIARQYDQLAGHFLEEGRAVVQDLLDGEFDAIVARSSAQMQAMFSQEDLSSLLPSFTTNQVHFEIPEYQLIFDAQVTDHTMTGVIQSGVITAFTVVRQTSAPAGSPVAGTPISTATLAGQWTGTTILPPDTTLDIALTFSDGGQQGTFSIPAQNLVDAPLSNITYRVEQPLGERIAERSAPISPELRLYWARYDWGGRELTMTIGFDDRDAIIGMLVAPEWQLPPDPAAGLPPLAPLRLPFDRLWWVFWGGETASENYHVTVQQQRHASDIVIWNDGATFHGDLTENENYWIWGQPVLAPANGTVVTVVDGIEANRPGVLPTDPPEVAGNHVVLQIGDAAYLILAHMQGGSISVKEGDQIVAGAPIGLVGNSGNSSEPHLHIHAMNDPDLSSPTTFSLPITFADVLVNGELAGEASLRQGTFISPAQE